MINITGREPVYEAQRFLRALHYDTNGRLPNIASDGIYGPETRAAVESFQRLNNIPVTGEIDYATWTKLYKAYLDALARTEYPEPLRVFPRDPDYVTARNENSDAVAIIQFVLRTLSNVYDGIDGEPPSGVYDESTIRDVKHFQSIHRLKPTGFVDRETWNELAAAYNRAQEIDN